MFFSAVFVTIFSLFSFAEFEFVDQRNHTALRMLKATKLLEHLDPIGSDSQGPRGCFGGILRDGVPTPTAYPQRPDRERWTGQTFEFSPWVASHAAQGLVAK